MRHWLGRGLAGMRLFTIGSTMPDQASWLDDPKTYPAWEAAGELGISICLQMSAKAFPQMIKMAERFPKVRILLDHMARPVLDDGPPYAAANSLFELAKIPDRLSQADAAQLHRVAQGQGDAGDASSRKLVSKFGASRLAWGSNYPSSEGSLPELLALATSALASLPQSDQDWIFAKTAQTLYPVLAK